LSCARLIKLDKNSIIFSNFFQPPSFQGEAGFSNYLPPSRPFRLRQVPTKEKKEEKKKKKRGKLTELEKGKKCDGLTIDVVVV